MTGLPPVPLQVLGTPIDVECGDSESRNALLTAWSRCLDESPTGTAPTGASTPDRVTVSEHTLASVGHGSGLAVHVTTEALRGLLGKRLALHAAGVADEDGRVVALIGPSGRGKSTAAAILGLQGWGYVTDEVVAVDDEGDVMPFPRPLVVSEPRMPGEAGAMTSPDALGLARCPDTLTIRRLVVLERSTAGPVPPRLERLNLLDALDAVAPNISALNELERPVQRLCALIDRCGGVFRLHYSEIEHAGQILRDLLTRQAPPPDLWTVPDGRPVPDGSVAWGLRDGRIRRVSYTDAVETDLEAFLLFERIPVRLSGIGLTIWQAAAAAPTLDEMVDLVVATHGEHPQARQLVLEAVQQLVDAQVIGYFSPRPLVTDHSAGAGVDSLPTPPD